jgi:hypothetical protein
MLYAETSPSAVKRNFPNGSTATDRGKSVFWPGAFTANGDPAAGWRLPEGPIEKEQMLARAVEANRNPAAGSVTTKFARSELVEMQAPT